MSDAAVHWVMRSRSGDLTSAEAAGMEAWLDADPANRAAFDALDATWQGIEPIRDDPRIAALRARVRARPRPWPAWAAAACLAVAVVGGGGYWFWPGDGSLSTQAFRTGVGEKATVTLPDGSVVVLSTDTVVRTRKAEGRRLVYLDRGQAFFEVAKDARRPFIVHAAGRTVTALGTAFEVRVDSGFKVTLVEGKVRVETASPAAPVPAPVQETVMAPGTQLVAAGDSWNVSRTDVQDATSWVRGQLVFVDEPLSGVAAEMNRFSERKIVVDAAAAPILISGAFKPGDVGAFVAAVEDYGLVGVESDTPGGVRLTSPKKRSERTGG